MTAPSCHFCRRLIGAGGSLADNGIWVCDRETCQSIAPTDRRPVLEMADGIPIVKKTVRRARYEVDDLLEAEDGVWRVVRIGPGGMDVRCVSGRRTGTATTWSTSPLGLRHVSEDEVEKRRIDAIVEKVTDADDTLCPNCHPGLEDRDELGRDYSCPNHVPPASAIENAIAGKRKLPAFIKPRKEGEVVDKQADNEKWKQIKKTLKEKGIALPEPGKGYRERLVALAKANGVEA